MAGSVGLDAALVKDAEGCHGFRTTRSGMATNGLYVYAVDQGQQS